ncbi:MAG: type II toxin-antitoxin system HicA family toxin [Desulfobulbaceae bacterium]|nr:type II toxin-antitoxin system HicA family toxin [Desulfobulbaceae bacterium]
MNSKDLIKMVEADDWRLIRVTGSHHHFKHPVKKELVTIPHPKRTLPTRTVKNILKQAELL